MFHPRPQRPGWLPRILKFIRNVTCGVSAVLFGLWLYLAQPTLRTNPPVEIPVDLERMSTVVRTLSVDFHPRDFRHVANLEKAATEIEAHFLKAGGRVSNQAFTVAGIPFRNVICRFGPETGPLTIIGAHYDSHKDTPGADDNASGVAGLIELAYLFGKQTPDRAIELVAFTLEEPPFFATTQMGSYVHAQSLAVTNTAVEGMIALEMIGYFSDEFGSQKYPSPLFHILYPNTGDFIAVIGRHDQRPYIAKIKAGMKGVSDLLVFSVSAPEIIPGIDFSDHRNYWAFGIPAVMVTNTAFYRNLEYHKPGDTWERLDYPKMANVIRAVYHAVTLGEDL